jgi:hypothetical protein
MMSVGTKTSAARKVMRVATMFTGVAACGAVFTPTAVAGTAQKMGQDTETGCVGNSKSGVCIALIGGGNHVSSVSGHWYGGTGCHFGHVSASLDGFQVYAYNRAGRRVPAWAKATAWLSSISGEPVSSVSAGTARPAQSSLGFGFCRRSTATSWRNTSSSASFEAASSAIQPTGRMNIR